MNAQRLRCRPAVWNTALPLQLRSSDAGRFPARVGESPDSSSDLTILRRLREQIQRVLPTAEKVRRLLATHPELSGKEVAAANMVEAVLREAGIRHERDGLHVIGVVGDGGQPAIFVRGEMDALPDRGGAAHLCGHDAHTGGAMALVLAANELHKQGWLPRPLVGVFQSSEEVAATSGARAVVASGRLRELGVGAGVASHLVGDRDFGTVAVDPGLVNAATINFDVKVIGVTGHGGYKRSRGRLNELRELEQRDGHAAQRSRWNDGIGIRPTLAASLFEQSLWEAVDAQFGDAGVVNFGRIIAGADGARNMIPGDATLEGSLRLLADDQDALEKGRELIIEQAQRAARRWNCDVEVAILRGFPAVVNDPRLAGYASALLAEAGLRQASERRTPGADDFAYYGDPRAGLGVPTLYAFVGLRGAPDWLPRSLHHVEFRAPPVVTRLVAEVDAVLYLAAVRRLGGDATR